MVGQALEQQDVNNILLKEYQKMLGISENVEVTETDAEIPEAAAESVEEMKVDVDTTEVVTETVDTEAISGVESEDVEIPEEKEVAGDNKEEVTEEAADEVEPEEGVEASKIEDVVEEEIPAASEGEEKVPEKKDLKGGDKPKSIKEPKKLDDFSAIVAIDASGKQLAVKAIMSYSKNQRYYLIYEKNADGTELGALNYAAKIEASKFEKKSNVVTDYIKNMSGNYNGQLGNIQLNLQKIEKYRMLKHSPIFDVDSSTSFDELYEKLKLFILHNVFDSRIAVFSVKNVTHVAIIRTTDKTLMQVFKDICREIDESVNPNVVKAELYSRDLLHHDNNSRCRDCQFTISSAIRERIGSRGDKVISIKFDDDFVEKIKLAYSIGSIEYEEYEKEEVI